MHSSVAPDPDLRIMVGARYPLIYLETCTGSEPGRAATMAALNDDHVRGRDPVVARAGDSSCWQYGLGMGGSLRSYS